MKSSILVGAAVLVGTANAYTPTVSGSFGDSFSTVVRSNVPTCKVIDCHTVVNCACCRLRRSAAPHPCQRVAARRPHPSPVTIALPLALPRSPC
jgi:hypothetical protein